MISAQTNKTIQERLVMNYMELPNQGVNNYLPSVRILINNKQLINKIFFFSGIVFWKIFQKI